MTSPFVVKRLASQQVDVVQEWTAQDLRVGDEVVLTVGPVSIPRYLRGAKAIVKELPKRRGGRIALDFRANFGEVRKVAFADIAGVRRDDAIVAQMDVRRTLISVASQNVPPTLVFIKAFERLDDTTIITAYGLAKESEPVREYTTGWPTFRKFKADMLPEGGEVELPDRSKIVIETRSIESLIADLRAASRWGTRERSQPIAAWNELMAERYKTRARA